MPLLPLYGHSALRHRLDQAISADKLPGSLLLQGRAGIGKQRLALWLGQRLLCTGEAVRPCGSCQHCRYALAGTHPDIHWYFPRPSLKSGDSTPAKVLDDFREAVAERTRTGAYAPAPPGEGIYVATIQSMVQSAALAPALGSRKIYIVGEAERMVLREGAEDSAGAFLKLLEEPPARATIILTSSEPGALIPTIRSRVVSVRMAPLAAPEMDALLAEPALQAAITAAGGPTALSDQRRLANGAAGALLAESEWADALLRARRVLQASLGLDRRDQARTALAQGSSKSRGAFSTSLDALTTLLHERVEFSARQGNDRDATRAARAMGAVDQARLRATGNVNPQLITSALISDLEDLLT